MALFSKYVAVTYATIVYLQAANGLDAKQPPDLGVTYRGESFR